MAHDLQADGRMSARARQTFGQGDREAAAWIAVGCAAIALGCQAVTPLGERNTVASIEDTDAFEDSLETDENDDFEVTTTDSDQCGVAEFVDHGPGASGGGNNDDYVLIHDDCADGHGVRASVWVDDIYLGSKYNGNGRAGAPVVWDPFRDYNPDHNVPAGQLVVLEVCLVDGPNDSSGAACRVLGSVIQNG